MTNSELRDHFAGLAMQSIVAHADSVGLSDMCAVLGEDYTIKETPLQWSEQWSEMFYRYTAHRAYQHADAMMRERDKP